MTEIMTDIWLLMGLMVSGAVIERVIEWGRSESHNPQPPIENLEGPRMSVD